MTPERLTILIVSELHREGIAPNLENVASDQVRNTCEKLLKLLGGLSESEQPKELPPATATTIPFRQPDVHSIDSRTQLLPIIGRGGAGSGTRYDWGRADAYPTRTQ